MLVVGALTLRKRAGVVGQRARDRAAIPVFDKSARDDGTFSRGDFDYNQEADIYVRPAGNALTSTGTLVNDNTALSRQQV